MCSGFLFASWHVGATVVIPLVTPKRGGGWASVFSECVMFLNEYRVLVFLMANIGEPQSSVVCVFVGCCALL